MPSLRVSIHVLASHTPQGSKAAASPTRSGSRRRARAKTKPQHALEPARSLESCMCLRKLQHSKRMGTLSSALGSRGCEQPTPCVPRLPWLAHLAGLGRPLKGLPAPMRPLPMPQDVEQSHRALKLAPADRGVCRRQHSKQPEQRRSLPDA